MPSNRITLLAFLALSAFALTSCSDDETPAPAASATPPATRAASTQPTAARGTVPSPELSPEEVVQIQLTALQQNDPANDRGIATVFRFASPQNRQMTGPLDRFAQMVRGPGYAPMLNFRSAEFLPIEQRGDEARQVVILTAADGTKANYLFMLSKQSRGDENGCWMTNGVVRVEANPTTTPSAPGATPI
jgi:hypothetical protein